MRHRWDLFVSYASEDRDTVVAPLVEKLQSLGLTVWFDQQELKLGDGLRRSIEKGLSNSRYGAVVLSPKYFAKEWPQVELDALFAAAVKLKKKILPVLHELEFSEALLKAPLIADRLCISTAEGLNAVASEIAKAVKAIGNPLISTNRRNDFKHADMLGSSIAGYTLKAIVGSGGSGIVFRTRRYEKELVIKVFYPLRSGYKHLIGMFEKGFRAVAAVRHPAVVKVLDSGYCTVAGSDTAFLVTEYVQGKILNVWNRSAKRSTTQRIVVAKLLAEALATCHETTYVDEIGIQSTGVLHGDIKPANIIVSAKGNPVLIDFLQIDVQRLIDTKVAISTFARGVSEAFGTPGYMAPEQERSGLITTRSDIYGLGITIAELFARTVYDLDYASGVPARFLNLVARMTQYDPSERPESMRDVSAELAEIINDEGGGAGA